MKLFPFLFPTSLPPSQTPFPSFLVPNFYYETGTCAEELKEWYSRQHPHALHKYTDIYHFFCYVVQNLSGDVSLPGVHFDLLFEKKDAFYISTMPLWHLRKLASQYSDFSTCPNNFSRSFVKPRSNSDSGSTFGEVSAVSSRERFFPFFLLMMLAF